MRRTVGIAIATAAVLGAGTVVALSVTPVSSSGHRLLHIGCANHSHGPKRTAGEGQRLLEARGLARQARPKAE